MPKLSTVLVLAVLCTAHVTYGFEGRSLKARASSNSQSKASSKGTGSATATATAVSNGGSASAKAVATSKTRTVIKNKLVEYCRYVFNQYSFPTFFDNTDGYCKDVFSAIDERILAVGEATAEAYAEVVAEVNVEGKGEACASGDAQATAEAEAFAAIFATAVAEATNKITKARAEALTSQIMSVFAKAFASAWGKACAKDDSSASVFQTSFAKASIKPIAILTIWVAAEVDCSGYAFAEVEALVDSKAESKTITTSDTTGSAKGTATAEGKGSATAATYKPCSGAFARCCFFHSGKTCQCKLWKHGRSRCNAKKENSSPLAWYDVKKKVSCYCP